MGGEESAKQLWGLLGAVSGVLMLLSGESIHPYSRVEADVPPHALFPPSVDPNDQKKTACYDIDVEVDDPLKAQMSNFLASTTNQQEIASLDAKVRGSARVALQGCTTELGGAWCPVLGGDTAAPHPWSSP